MKNMFNKANAPYLVSSTLAIATLLASGVFAAAPYVGFLAPVAALSVGLPFIIGGAVFSALIFALSAAVISKNKTISEKDTQLASQAEEVEGKGTEIANLGDQLAEKEQENSTLKDQVTNLEQVTAEKEREIEGTNTALAEETELITTKDKKIAEDALKVVIADNTIQTARGTVNGALRCSKYTDNNLPSSESVTKILDSVKNRLCDTKFSSTEEQFKHYAEDGCKPSNEELARLDYLDLIAPVSKQEQRTNSLDDLNIDNVSKQLDLSSIDVAKRYLTSLSKDQNIFYGAESGDKKDTEISSLEKQLNENSKTKILSKISDLCESVKEKLTSFWSGVQSICGRNIYNIGTNLLYAQHTRTLANVPQEEVINKEAQKPEEQVDQKLNLQRSNSINNTEEGGKNKRSHSARRKRKSAQVKQPTVYAVETRNRFDCLSPDQMCP